MTKKPIALCKTWSGKEFVIPAIKSIYEHVEKIVFVHSSISWSGEIGNEVEPIISEWRENNDTENKVINLTKNTTNQYEQYKFGLDYISHNFINELVLFFDTDEVWDSEDLERAIKYANDNPEANGYCSHMYTYVKSPFYRVSPREIVVPVVLYRVKSNSFNGSRGCNIYPLHIIPYVKFHHFTYVRESEIKLFQKIRNTFEAEKCYESIDLDEWKREKWDKLPYSKNLFTVKGYEDWWKGVEIVGLADLPEYVRYERIVKKSCDNIINDEQKNNDKT